MKQLRSIIFIAFFTSVQSSLMPDILFEGESCKNNDGVQGVCKKIKDCTTAPFAIKQGKRPKICSFAEQEAILCCPPETQYRPQTNNHQYHPTTHHDSKAVNKAKQKCAEYAKSVILEIDSPVLTSGGEKEIIDQCARIEEPLVIGGEKAKPKEYPHMALIGYGARRNTRWLCGGSLISERFVISAAHCSDPQNLGPAQWVKLGELDTSEDFEDANPQVIKIIQRIDHPKYNPSGTLYNDITLFKLEHDVIFDAYIRPICLSTSPSFTTHTAIATGWGHTHWGGHASESLLKVRLNLVNEKKCNTKLKNSTGSKLPQGIISSQVCAGDEKGKDTCQGDSGGPLQNPINNPYCMYEIIGVTSFGKGCALGYPGVYTRVYAYLPWIVENVWPE